MAVLSPLRLFPSKNLFQTRAFVQGEVVNPKPPRPRPQGTSSDEKPKKSKVNILHKLEKLKKRNHISKREAARIQAFEDTRWHKRNKLSDSEESKGAVSGEVEVTKPIARIDSNILDYVEGLQLGRRRLKKLSKEQRDKKFDDKSYIHHGRVLIPKEELQGEKGSFAEKVAAFFSLPFACQYSAGAVESIPNPIPGVPEIAVVGRSNVGKSSLLNALAGSRIVRTSARPGKTRTISWFSLGAKKGADSSKIKAFLVDVPGIGFAYASKEQKEIWQSAFRTFLENRPKDILRRVLVLVDSRHSLMPHEIDFLKFLDKCGVAYQLVLTKADLVPPIMLARRIQDHAQQLSKGFNRLNREIHAVSQRSPKALHTLRCALYEIFHAPPDPNLVQDTVSLTSAPKSATKSPEVPEPKIGDVDSTRPSLLKGYSRKHAKIAAVPRNPLKAALSRGRMKFRQSEE